MKQHDWVGANYKPPMITFVSINPVWFNSVTMCQQTPTFD